MMRRAMASLLMLSMLQLTTLEVRAECDRHAAVAKQAAAATATQADDAHAHHAGHAPTKAPADTQNVPAPKCCMVAGTCNVGAFATIVRVAESATGEDATIFARAGLLPRSLTLAPEPPPPKA
jgi:hypothetical protein